MIVPKHCVKRHAMKIYCINFNLFWLPFSLETYTSIYPRKPIRGLIMEIANRTSMTWFMLSFSTMFFYFKVNPFDRKPIVDFIAFSYLFASAFSLTGSCEKQGLYVLCKPQKSKMWVVECEKFCAWCVDFD